MTSAAAVCPPAADAGLAAREAAPDCAPELLRPAGRGRWVAAGIRGAVRLPLAVRGGIPGIAGPSAVRVAVAVPAAVAAVLAVPEPVTALLPLAAPVAAAPVPGMAARLPVAVPDATVRVAAALAPSVLPVPPPWAGWALAGVLAAVLGAVGRLPLPTKPTTPCAPSGPGYW